MTPLPGEHGAPGCRDKNLPDFGPGVASPARIWNYWLGGKDHYAADRKAAEAVHAALPVVPAIARQTRRFLASAVHMLAADYGIRQFLDIGSGIPAVGNVHEIAQRAAPESRVVYVDYDPVVLAHARALLTSSPQGRIDCLQADLRDAGTITAQAARTLDLTRPSAVLLLAVLHFIPDTDDPYTAVKKLMSAMAPGSFLVIVHGANDILSQQVAEGLRRYNEHSAEPLTLRSRREVAGFFNGLDPVGPGVDTPSRWDQFLSGRTDSCPQLPCYCGIGRKPGTALQEENL